MSSKHLSDIVIALVAIALFTTYVLGTEWFKLRKFRKQFDPTLKLAISKENKKLFLLYLGLAILATGFFFVVLPVGGVVPMMIVLLMFQSKTIYVGETHIYQGHNCLLIDKIKHARLEVKGSTKTLNFKYKNNHLSMNLSLMDETDLMKRLKS